MSKPAKPAEEKPIIYDASANNRFDYEARQNGRKYDIAHIFGALTDERYMQWNRDLKVRGVVDKIEEHSREATVALWDDIIVSMDGAEYDATSDDWKQFVEDAEKLQSINDLMAVAIVEPDADGEAGKLRLGPPPKEQTIVTECFFNGNIVQQAHVLRTKTREDENRYDRIQQKRVKHANNKGLRTKPSVEYIPQDEKLGELYDSMIISADGFADNFVPLRFKVLVVHSIFAPTMDPQLVGKSQ